MNIVILIFFLRFYLFNYQRQRERGLHAWSPVWDSIPGPGVTTWAEGRRSTAEPLRDPLILMFCFILMFLRLIQSTWIFVWLVAPNLLSRARSQLKAANSQVYFLTLPFFVIRILFRLAQRNPILARSDSLKKKGGETFI